MALGAIAGAAAASISSLLINPGTQSYVAVNLGTTAYSGVRINTNRDIEERDNALYTDSGDWLDPSGTAADYEVQFEQVSGATLQGVALNTYHALSASREVYIATTGIGGLLATATVTIRRAAAPADSISFTVNLSATEDVGI